eukprot:COSAG06_NODE_38005_length_428_cov_1.170213_1_plen_54_part_10
MDDDRGSMQGVHSVAQTMQAHNSAEMKTMQRRMDDQMDELRSQMYEQTEQLRSR